MYLKQDIHHLKNVNWAWNKTPIKENKRRIKIQYLRMSNAENVILRTWPTNVLHFFYRWISRMERCYPVVAHFILTVNSFSYCVLYLHFTFWKLFELFLYNKPFALLRDSRNKDLFLQLPVMLFGRSFMYLVAATLRVNNKCNVSLFYVPIDYWYRRAVVGN